MKILFDTSVIVPALITSHPKHNQAFLWLKRAISGEFDMIVASHTIAELYAVLTSIPVSPKITPSLALRLICENIETRAEIISLTSSDYIDTIRFVGSLGLTGGVMYDAIIVKAALKAEVDKILTFNINHFKRIYPGNKAIIIIP